MKEELLKSLKKIPEFTTVPEDQLAWLIAQGEVLRLKEGDYLFKPGDPIDRLLVMLEGHVVLKAQQGNQFRVLGTFEKHTISGYLPYSRASEARGFAQVTKATSVLILPKSKFREMINTKEALTTALVHTMSTRIREFTKSQQQNDKIMALGKLSAGLAHELNNPSAAIVRSAQNLGKQLRVLPEGFKNIIKIQMTDQQVDSINQILFDKLESKPAKLTIMQKSALEDEFLDWLEDHEILNSEEIAENLASFGFQVDDLEAMNGHVNSSDLSAVIGWINQVLSTEQLVKEIEEASQRINKLVSSIKSYTHMDQAPERSQTDLHEGIENTLTMLNHKLKKNNIKVERTYSDLPEVRIFVSEMNQVWTNIIDNAIDAMQNVPEPTLGIRTMLDGDFVNVYISDSGSGIPEEIQGKIFDPFFTTKPVGQGTGLGMEVVHQIVTNQHQGSITFESRPGFTEFKVCFPK